MELNQIGNKRPAFGYDKFGQKYSGQRRTDPIIEKYVHDALGSAKTVLNVGTGSYEPKDKYVIAVGPSFAMRSQRIGENKVPAIIGKADRFTI